jgi:hypothetical protein
MQLLVPVYMSLALREYTCFLHRIIGLFYYKKQQEKLYNYFTVYYTYVCLTRMSALTEVDISSLPKLRFLASPGPRCLETPPPKFL